jgi:hypothetical protein
MDASTPERKMDAAGRNIKHHGQHARLVHKGETPRQLARKMKFIFIVNDLIELDQPTRREMDCALAKLPKQLQLHFP